MNLCKIGIHDYETLYNYNEVYNEACSYMYSLGFTPKYDNYKIISFIKDDLEINERAWFDEWNTFSACIPYPCKIKVCLNCGKIVKNHNMDKIKRKLDKVINVCNKENEREKLAQRLYKK